MKQAQLITNRVLIVVTITIERVCTDTIDNADDIRQLLQASSTAAMLQPKLDGKANPTMASLILPGMKNDEYQTII